MDSFYVGQEWGSFNDFRAALLAYQDKNKVLFSVFRSEKADGDDELVYSSITYACKHYGDKRSNPCLTGERPRQKTYKIQCEAFIKLKRSKKLKKLKVKELNLKHNHPCSNLTFKGYPEMRRLSAEAVGKVEELQKVKVKPTLIRPQLRDLEGKLVLGRDISNIRTKNQKAERNGRSDEEMLMSRLADIKSKDPGACAHIEIDAATGEVIFILIQTSDMRESLQRFPEVLIMDITYKINKNKMPVSVIEVMDGDGRGRVVCYAFLANETKVTLTKMLDHFVSVSGRECFSATQCVVVDKDFAEISSIRDAIPNAIVHICSIHTEKAFKAAAKVYNEPKKKDCLEVMKKMIYSSSSVQFDEHYDAFKNLASAGFLGYFNKNWLNVREAWSLKDKSLAMNLRNHSTNRVENHNQKLKIVFDSDTSLFDAVTSLVIIIQRNQKDDIVYKTHEALTKRVYVNKCTDPTINQICNDLTDYAAKMVCEQLHLSKQTSDSKNQNEASTSACSCLFFKTMRLTCRHIMRARKKAGLPVYSKEIIIRRWWKDFNYIPGPPTTTPTGTSSESSRMPAEPILGILTSSEEYRLLIPVTQQLNSVMTNCGTKTFYHRLQILRDLIEAWTMGSYVAVVPIGHKHEQGDLTEEEIEVLENQDDVTGEDKNTNEQQFAQTSPKQAPFSLKKYVIRGKPSGRNQTVHNRGKKRGTVPLKIVRTKGQPKAQEMSQKRSFEEVKSEGDTDVSDIESEINQLMNGTKDNTLSSAEAHTPFQPGEQISKNCAVCHKEAGGHHCITCKRVVHAVPPCSQSLEEGYGKPVSCTLCQKQETSSRAPVSSRMNNVCQCHVCDLLIYEDSITCFKCHKVTHKSECSVVCAASADDSEVGLSMCKKCSEEAILLIQALAVNYSGNKPYVPISVNLETLPILEDDPDDKALLDLTLSAEEAESLTGEDVKQEPIAPKPNSEPEEIIVLSSDSESDIENASPVPVPFTLKVTKAKGRPKAAVKQLTKPWSFKELLKTSGEADEGQERGQIHQPHFSNVKQLSLSKTSLISANQAVDKEGDLLNVSKDTFMGSFTASKKYICRKGCRLPLERRMCLGKKEQKNFGRYYYGCFRNNTSNCQPFLFWASKEESKSLNSHASQPSTESVSFDYGGGRDDGSMTPQCYCGDNCIVRQTQAGKTYYGCWKHKCHFVEWISEEVVPLETYQQNTYAMYSEMTNALLRALSAIAVAQKYGFVSLQWCHHAPCWLMFPFFSGYYTCSSLVQRCFFNTTMICPC